MEVSSSGAFACVRMIRPCDVHGFIKHDREGHRDKQIKGYFRVNNDRKCWESYVLDLSSRSCRDWATTNCKLLICFPFITIDTVLQN